MSKINTGGSAFPVPEENYLSNGAYSNPGMTLRDWFAGHAIRARWNSGEPMTAEEAASFAYQLADAMLAAREVAK